MRITTPLGHVKTETLHVVHINIDEHFLLPINTRNNLISD